MDLDIYTLLGVGGAACFIFSYFATLQGWLVPDGWRFPAINLAGALLVLTSLMEAWNLPSVVLECFWAAISVYGIFRAVMRRA